MQKFLQSLAVVVVSLTHTLPACLLTLALYMCTSIHINFLYVYSIEQKLFQSHSNLFQANLDAV